jgi:hypothetical protein
MQIKPRTRVTLLTSVLGSVFCLTALTAAGAECDLITLSGKGTVNPQTLRITGTETLMVRDSEKPIPMTFTAEPLGMVETGTDGSVKLVYSHEFQSLDKRTLAFTTTDEIQVVPLPPFDEDAGPDPTCQTNKCGLVFRLKLLEGHGRYNCGEIVSGYNPAYKASSGATPESAFTSYSDKGTSYLNSQGKLCKCSGNN